MRNLHAYMTERRTIALADGRSGKIVRVDTEFPSNSTTVTVWTQTSLGPRIAKVRLGEIVGPVDQPKTA